MHPPSIWITSGLAILYLIQIVRHLCRVVHFGGDTSWSKALSVWSIFTMVPVVICAINSAKLPEWSPVIEWMREHVISVIAGLLVASEPLLLGGQLLNIQRLVLLSERSKDLETIKTAAIQLELHGVYDLAIEAHERALGFNPDSAEAQVHIAALYGILRRFRDSEKAAKHAIDIIPKSSLAHFYLGMANLEQGRIADAIANLEKAVSLGLPEVQLRVAENVLKRFKHEYIF